MSGLRIMFEVDEKHVGACLVALEGRARNLNFEVIADADWQKNRPAGRGPDKGPRKNGHGKLTPEFVLKTMQEHPQGSSKESLGVAVKLAGFKVQGLNSIMLSLVKKKVVKKVGQAYVMTAASREQG